MNRKLSGFNLHSVLFGPWIRETLEKNTSLFGPVNGGVHFGAGCCEGNERLSGSQKGKGTQKGKLTNAQACTVGSDPQTTPGRCSIFKRFPYNNSLPITSSSPSRLSWSWSRKDSLPLCTLSLPGFGLDTEKKQLGITHAYPHTKAICRVRGGPK